MDRMQRFETLARTPKATPGFVERILDGSLGEVTVIVPPTVGMILARVVDGAKGETFNLGEVLVTEARVSIRGCEGWGMVMGSSPDHALAVAIVEAGLEAGHWQRAEIERDLLVLATEAEAADQAEVQRVAPTLVQFDTF